MRKCISDDCDFDRKFVVVLEMRVVHIIHAFHAYLKAEVLYEDANAMKLAQKETVGQLLSVELSSKCHVNVDTVSCCYISIGKERTS